MTLLPSALPILNCDEAAALEASLLTDQAAEWAAMKLAGKGIAAALLRDYQEIRQVPERPRVLGLVGKGHNGGDAILACAELLAVFPRAQVALLFVAAPEDLKPLTAKAYADVEGRVAVRHLDAMAERGAVEAALQELTHGEDVDLCIDGLLGMSFTPPIRGAIEQVIRSINESTAIWLRGAVDLPSGLSKETVAMHQKALKDEDVEAPLVFRADFSYATGVVKAPLINEVIDCGRVRWIDLGFFNQKKPTEKASSGSFVLGKSILKERLHLRRASADKRDFGHLFIVAGSRQMPGALLMAARAAVKSGVGRVTAFAPSSAASAFAAQLPEAMWFPMPESPNGFLSLRGLPFLFDRLPAASAILMGPGMGMDRQTDNFVMEVLSKIEIPAVLDADALTSKVLEFVGKRRSSAPSVIATPHMGELFRMSKRCAPGFSNEDFCQFCESNRVTTVLKGPMTRISDGSEVYYSPFGGPVLARGGSGDLLAGLIAGLLAQNAHDPCRSAAEGVVLHGLAAELMARDCGQHFVQTCDLLNYLTRVSRS